MGIVVPTRRPFVQSVVDPIIRSGGLPWEARQGGSPRRILSFDSGTFTRSTAGWYYPDNDSQASVAANVRRSLDNPDNLGPLTLIEPARTNLLARSSQFGHALWAKSGVTVDDNAGTAPDGAATADRLNFTAAAANNISQPFLGTTTDNHLAALSGWLRTEAGTKDLRLRLVKKDGTTVDVPITVTTTWQRFFNAGAAGVVGVGATQPKWMLINDAAGTAGSVLAWAGQAEADTAAAMRIRAATSVVETTGDGSATRGAELLTWAAGAYDIGPFNKRWSFVFSPYWNMGGGSIESAGQQLDLFSFGGTQDYVAFTGSQQIIVVQGNVLKVTKSAITANRHGRFKIIVDPLAGSITVEGALTGDGTTVGTPWAWASGLALRVGGRFGAGSEPVGRYGEPYAS